MPLISANSITINYTLSTPTPTHSSPSSPNPAPLVVLIAGLADPLTTWHHQLPALLSAGYRVLAYDNRGIGGSSAPAGPYTADQLAQDLHALLVALGERAAHLVGLSMGGMVAQAYALRYPNRQAGGSSAEGIEMLSLTLACTYARPSPFCARLFALWADMAAAMGVGVVLRAVALWAFTPPFFSARPEELEAVEREMEEAGRRMGLPAYLAQLNVIQEFDSTGALAGLRAGGVGLGALEPRKVLVLAGKTDVLIPVPLSRELAELMEGSVWKTVKGGHACCWEFPTDFNDALVDFLDSCTKA